MRRFNVERLQVMRHTQTSVLLLLYNDYLKHLYETIEDMVFIHGFEALIKNKLPDPSLIPETPEWFLLCCEDTLVPGYGGGGGILT